MHFVLAGDTNELKLDSILHLDTRFSQIVQKWSRMDPPAILDPIIMMLGNLYQEPDCLEPLDADPDKIGVKSDHRIVVARPINTVDNKCTRQTKTIKYRSFPESGLLKMRDWFIDETWKEVYETESAIEKAKVFQEMLIDKLNEIFPEKNKNKLGLSWAKPSTKLASKAGSYKAFIEVNFHYAILQYRCYSLEVILH